MQALLGRQWSASGIAPHGGAVLAGSMVCARCAETMFDRCNSLRSLFALPPYDRHTCYWWMGAGEGRNCVGPVQLLLGVTSENSVGWLYAGLAFANLAFWLLTDPDGYARNFPIAILPVGE